MFFPVREIPIIMIAHKELKSTFNYNPETGFFLRIKNTTNRIQIGTIAGTVRKDGYRKIGFNNVIYFAHRLAWFWMTEEWPKHQIDHINGLKDDNRWSNLRLATPHQNGCNTKLASNNTSGIKGVWKCQLTGKWAAAIKVEKKTKWIGRFEQIEQAVIAIQNTRNNLHKEFSNHG